MNIYEVIIILLNEPDMVAEDLGGAKIYYNKPANAIYYKGLDTPFLLTDYTTTCAWSIKDKEVDFMTAFNAWQKLDKTIYSRRKNETEAEYIYLPSNKELSILPKEILEYKWFIKYKQ